MTIESALGQFLAQLTANGRSPHTIRQYRRHVTAFASWCMRAREKLVVEQIDHIDIAEFMGSHCVRVLPDGRPKRPGTTNAIRSSLKGFFAYLHRAEYLSTDPSRLLRRALCSNPAPKALPPEQVRRLFSALNAAVNDPFSRRDRVLILLMLQSGLRLSEAVGLDSADLDLEKREIAVRCGKGSRDAIVPLNQQVTREISSWIAERAEGALFIARDGRRLSARHVERRLTGWAICAGISSKVTPHRLRHTFAMRLYEKTGDLGIVQSALRHRSISTTQVYARASDDSVRRALDA